MSREPECADLTTEQVVLGCVLSGTLPSAATLPPEAFTEHRRNVWEAMQALEAEHSSVDHLTVADRLKARGQLAGCGGPAALMELDSGIPFTENLPHYAAILRDRMARRSILATLATARLKALDLNAAPLATANGAATALSAIRGPRTLKRAGELVYRLTDKWHKNLEAPDGSVAPCLPWPHVGMDAGVPFGRVSVVAGRSGNFKTGLVADGMWYWANSMKLPGGVIGLEDGCDWWIERLTGRAVGIAYEEVGFARLDEEHKGQETALANWCGTAHGVMEERVFFEDYRDADDSSSSISFPEVFATIRNMVEGGARWIVIDHGLKIDWARGASTDRYDMAIGHGIDKCALYAERTGAAIIFLWHLNRAQQEGSTPQRSDLKESSYVDAAARKIYVLWKHADKPGVQLVTTVKATKGEEGVTVALPLTDAKYGLLARTGGYRVDFVAEAAERKAQADAARVVRNGKGKHWDSR